MGLMAEPGEPAGDPAGLPLSVGAVARLLGVAPPTLRTWDRRYGLAPSERSDGRHRRYTPVDLARLAHMRQLTLRGVPPAEAAAAALATPADRLAGALAPGLPGAPAPPGQTLLPGGRRSTDPPLSLVRPVPDAVVAPPRPPTARSDRPAGFQLGRVSAQARGLARAVLEMDAAAVTELVTDSVARQGVVPTWDHVVAPVLVAVGRRWRRTGTGIEIEHLFSEAVLGVLAARAAAMAGEPSNTRPVLLAATADELHVLTLHALGAALAERRVQARLLGARVPGSALAVSVRRLSPSVVFLWSQVPATAQVDTADLLGGHPPPALVLGGPGWSPGGLPAGALLAGSLTRATDLVSSLAA